MKIVELRATNIKRLRAVQIKPDGSLVVIGGNNGQGKTSVLDSIMYALAGKREICDKPVRDGQEFAKATLDLGDITVTRFFDSTGKSTLKVESKDGAEYSSPQKMLDGLIGKLSFDPLAFLNYDAKKQTTMLRDLVGLDFAKIDGDHQFAYADRSDTNRTIGELDFTLSQITVTPDLPEEEISVGALAQEIAEAKSCENDVSRMIEELSRTKQKIEELQDAANAMQGRLDTLRQSRVNVGGLEDQLSRAEDVNVKIRENKRAGGIAVQLRESKDESERLTKVLDELKANKIKALSEAKFPVEGLSFSGDHLIFNGQPFEQASHAEQLKVACAMGLSANPELRIILIRDGSLLDEESLAEVAKMAEENDAQVWIERVGKGREVTVIIEDGLVEEVMGEADVVVAEEG